MATGTAAASGSLGSGFRLRLFGVPSTTIVNLDLGAVAAQALAVGEVIRTPKAATPVVQAAAGAVLAEVAAIHLFMSTREKIAGAMAALVTAIREAAVPVAAAVVVIPEDTAAGMGDMGGTVVQILTPAAAAGPAVVTWVAALSRSLLLGLLASQWPGSL